jgi:hypothetical protein
MAEARRTYVVDSIVSLDKAFAELDLDGTSYEVSLGIIEDAVHVPPRDVPAADKSGAVYRVLYTIPFPELEADVRVVKFDGPEQQLGEVEKALDTMMGSRVYGNGRRIDCSYNDAEVTKRGRDEKEVDMIIEEIVNHSNGNGQKREAPVKPAPPTKEDIAKLREQVRSKQRTRADIRVYSKQGEPIDVAVVYFGYRFNPDSGFLGSMLKLGNVLKKDAGPLGPAREDKPELDMLWERIEAAREGLPPDTPKRQNVNITRLGSHVTSIADQSRISVTPGRSKDYAELLGFYLTSIMRPVCMDPHESEIQLHMLKALTGSGRFPSVKLLEDGPAERWKWDSELKRFVKQD